MICKHCHEHRDSVNDCPICETKPTNQCLTCHLEVNHGKITNQNIHICGGPSPPQNGPDHMGGDTDAYKPSWKGD